MAQLNVGKNKPTATPVKISSTCGAGGPAEPVVMGLLLLLGGRLQLSFVHAEELVEKYYKKHQWLSIFTALNLSSR